MAKTKHPQRLHQCILAHSSPNRPPFSSLIISSRRIDRFLGRGEEERMEERRDEKRRHSVEKGEEVIVSPGLPIYLHLPACSIHLTTCRPAHSLSPISSSAGHQIIPRSILHEDCWRDHHPTLWIRTSVLNLLKLYPLVSEHLLINRKL